MPRNVITTVVTAATSIALTDLATVKSDWNIATDDDDDFVTRSITRCSRAAANFCNRTFAIETVQDQIALRRDPWPRMTHERPEILQLTRWPIVAVTSVTVDGTALVAGTDFMVDQTNGQLQRLNAYGAMTPWTGETIIIVYSAGYVLPGQSAVAGAQNLPDDIQDAVSRMVYTRYAERQRDPLVKSEQVDGVGRTDYIVPSGDGNLSPDVEDILANYRIPVVG
jgi:hypothetical protein